MPLPKLKMFNRGPESNPPEKESLPEEQSSFYRTLFQKLLAELPSNLTTSAAGMPAVMMMKNAVRQLSEEQLRSMAQHVKLLGARIVYEEREHGLTEGDTTKLDG